MADDHTKRKNIFARTFSEFSDDECMMMGSSLAFYTMLSLPALLVIVVTVAGWIWSPQAVMGQIEQQIGGVIGEGGQQQIRSMVEKANKPQQQSGVVAMLIGIGVLLFGATGVVAQLQSALNKAWEVQPDPEQSGVMAFLKKRVASFAMILGIAFLLLVSLVLTTVVSAGVGAVFGGLSSTAMLGINAGVSFVIFTLLFAAMFKWLPDAEIPWKEVWIGAAMTSLLFMAGKFLMGLYVGRANPGEAYGAAASLVLILIWAYYSSLILFLGAEFTQVWARRHGQRIEPAEGAVRVVAEKHFERPHRPDVAA